MSKAVIYLRVSTDDQAKDGVSLDAQRDKCKAYCIAHDYEIAGIFSDEGKSGKDLHREGIQEAFSMLENKEADTLLVLQLDRMTRSLDDLGKILKHIESHGWQLASVKENFDTSNAAGRMVLNVIMSINQWYREDVAEKTKTALQHKRSKGEKIGGTREFGYDVKERKSGDKVKKVYKKNDREQKIIKLLKTLRDDGMTLQAIAKELKRRKIKTVSGKTTWGLWTISKLLKRHGVDVGKDRKTRKDKGKKRNAQENLVI